MTSFSFCDRLFSNKIFIRTFNFIKDIYITQDTFYNTMTSFDFCNKLFPYLNFMRIFSFKQDIHEANFKARNNNIGPSTEINGLVVIVSAICIVQIKNNKLVLSTVFFIMFNMRIRFTKTQKEIYLNKLKECHTFEFFTIETIHITDGVKNTFDKEFFSFFVISKMK